MSKILIHCYICNKPYLRYKSLVNTKTPVCSKICKSVLWRTKFLGENNGNFGNKWSKEQKQKQSALVKSKVTDEYRYKSGNANRGKKFTAERVARMHSHRTKESYSHPKSEEQKRQIGIKSKQKFTQEYKQRHRKIQEEKGHWIPLSQKNDFIFYRECANWIKRMFDIVDDKFDKLKEHGVYSSYTNIKGVVRDHIYSRKSGFNNGVFPEILRHPCNCQLLTHSENIRKKKNRYQDADEITLETLFENITNYKKEWIEQEKCIKLINDYKIGKRYNKQDYITKIYESTNN